MAALATPFELGVWLRRTVNAAQGRMALDLASGLVRRHCGWSISQETVTLTLDGSGTPTMWLPTLRLTAVNSMIDDGKTLVLVTDFDWTSYGRLIRNGSWSPKPRSVVTNITHGYPLTAIPDEVKTVVLALAGREVDNPRGLRSQSVGGVSWTVAGAASDVGPLLNDEEEQVLGDFQLGKW